jgi:hypothetical protein
VISFAATGGSVSERDLKAFERAHGVALPSEYRSFLSANDGAEPEVNVLSAPGVDPGMVGVDTFLSRAEIDEKLEILGDRLPPGLLPVADAAGGNLVLVDVGYDRPGRVYFWDHELEDDNPIIPLVEGFYDFLEALRPAEDVPDDAVADAEVWMDTSFREEMRRQGLLEE